MRSPWLALADAFDDLGAIVWRLSDSAFLRPSGPGGETVAVRVRECLDQFQALDRAVTDSGQPSGRGTPWAGAVVDRLGAIEALRQATWRTLCLANVGLDRPVTVSWSSEHGGSAVTARSSVSRELTFILSGIHQFVAVIETTPMAARPLAIPA